MPVHLPTGARYPFQPVPGPRARFYCRYPLDDEEGVWVTYIPFSRVLSSFLDSEMTESRYFLLVLHTACCGLWPLFAPGPARTGADGQGHTPARCSPAPFAANGSGDDDDGDNDGDDASGGDVDRDARAVPMLFAALQLDDHEPLRARRRREDGGWRLVSTQVLKESCAATTPATSELMTLALALTP